MFRFTIWDVLLVMVVVALAVFGGAFGGYAATQQDPQGNIVAGAIFGAFFAGAGLPFAIGGAAFQRFRFSRLRFRLRTLLILLTLAPPALAGGYRWWAKSVHHRNIGGTFCGSFVIENYNDGTSAMRYYDRPIPPRLIGPTGGRGSSVSYVDPLAP